MRISKCQARCFDDTETASGTRGMLKNGFGRLKVDSTMNYHRASPTVNRAASRPGKSFRIRLRFLRVRSARRGICTPFLGVCGACPGRINSGLIDHVPGRRVLTGYRLGINGSSWRGGRNDGGGPLRIIETPVGHGSRTGQGFSGRKDERMEAETRSGYSCGSKTIYVKGIESLVRQIGI